MSREPSRIFHLPVVFEVITQRVFACFGNVSGPWPEFKRSFALISRRFLQLTFRVATM